MKESDAAELSIVSTKKKERTRKLYFSIALVVFINQQK
jgi:hypothetical protein